MSAFKIKEVFPIMYDFLLLVVQNLILSIDKIIVDFQNTASSNPYRFFVCLFFLAREFIWKHFSRLFVG